MAILPADANVTLVAMLTSRRRLSDINDDVDTGASASTAEQVWAAVFMVVVIIILVCLCLVCCTVFAQFAGCGSFLGRAVLVCCPGRRGAGGEKKQQEQETTESLLPEAQVVGFAPLVANEKHAPLKSNSAPTTAAPETYTCCGLELPCLAWFQVCGCSFVGCAWLSACWARLCGGGGGVGGGNRRDGARHVLENSGGGLSLAQNVLTCWSCCGTLPLCCPAQYAHTPPPPRQKLQNGAVVATPVPIQVVRGTPVKEEDAENTAPSVAAGSRPMPALNLARRG